MLFSLSQIAGMPGRPKHSLLLLRLSKLYGISVSQHDAPSRPLGGAKNSGLDGDPVYAGNVACPA